MKNQYRICHNLDIKIVRNDLPPNKQFAICQQSAELLLLNIRLLPIGETFAILL